MSKTKNDGCRDSRALVLPASAKRYFSGSRADVKVPYRELSLSETTQRQG